MEDVVGPQCAQSLQGMARVVPACVAAQTGWVPLLGLPLLGYAWGDPIPRHLVGRRSMGTTLAQA